MKQTGTQNITVAKRILKESKKVKHIIISLVFDWKRFGRCIHPEEWLQRREVRRTFIPLSVSLWNALVDPVFDGVGLAGFKSRSNAFLLA